MIANVNLQPRTRLGGAGNRSLTYLVAHFGCVGHVANGEPFGCGRIESNEIIRRHISRDQSGQLLKVTLETSRSWGHTIWHERLCDGPWLSSVHALDAWTTLRLTVLD